MNAQELTKRYRELEKAIDELKEAMSTAEMEITRLKMITSDLQIDLKMMARERR